MAYILLGLAVVIILTGIARLRGGVPHATPWRALLLWIALFGAGVVLWSMALPR